MKKKKTADIDLDPDDVRRGLGQLVLTLVELLRELLERQALRRVAAGTLTAAQVERLGRALSALRNEMDTLRQHFGLSEEDLNLDLGPLGKLL
ncbi:MAG: gas vesicle protein K [Planctomycetes bacterium]|nr:gas vesicle protein K [Planctomycetota bacterium]